MDVQTAWESLSGSLQNRRNIFLALGVPLLGIAAAGLAAAAYASPTLEPPIIHRAPRKSLDLLLATTGQDSSEPSPYPSDALPGGRDVDTPYGNIRVYEWGPEEGRKVLFVHGISTPSIAFGRLADLLVEEGGCRVMLFDLFGRGYSDAPDPAVYRQDAGLWTSQMLLALTSSSLAWTGSARFTLIGYSLGGGVAANFASYFPDMVESLVLIAPGGLIRPHHFTRSSRMIYGDFLPRFMVDYFVRGRMSSGSAVQANNNNNNTPSANPANVMQAEIPDSQDLEDTMDLKNSALSDRPSYDVTRTVKWQLEVHPGFLTSFISAIKYSPVRDQHERWRLIGDRCEARRASADPDEIPGLSGNQVLILLGVQDNVIVADETEEDAKAILGSRNVRVVKLDCGHDLPISNSQGCADAIFDMWDDYSV